MTSGDEFLWYEFIFANSVVSCVVDALMVEIMNESYGKKLLGFSVKICFLIVISESYY